MWVQGSGLGEPEGPPVIHLEVFVGGSREPEPAHIQGPVGRDGLAHRVLRLAI